jgi:aryl-phospho-beta-D-glucosidase BglC (GH1 family)
MKPPLRLSIRGYWAARFAIALILLGTLAPGPGRAASPQPAGPCASFGVTLSGGEFGAVPGVYGEDYSYPGIDAEGEYNEWELDYFHGKGLNLIRLPLQWERLQHELNGPLTPFDLGLVDQVVANAAARGMSVILGPHNFAVRTDASGDHLIGSPEVPYSAFTDFWRRMAAHFAGRPGVYAYALDNEPHDTGGLWITGGAQAGIDGIRQADMATPILVPGDDWSHAVTWVDAGNDALRNLRDPADNLIFEAHQYFDDDYSGEYAQSYDAQGAYPTLGVDELRPFVTWLRDHQLRGMVTEYGVPNDDPRWLTVLDNALTFLQQNSDVILGGAYWSAGARWPLDYPLSVQPAGTWPDVTDRPQMGVLVAHAGCTVPLPRATSTPSPTPPLAPPSATATALPAATRTPERSGPPPTYPPTPLPGGGSSLFPETGHRVGGLFLDYWASHGALAQQGYPISENFTEISDLNHQPYTVQYFERAVFEYHPENKAPFDVLLSQLGTFQYRQKYPAGAPDQRPNRAPGDFRYFTETGHTVGGKFWDYWQTHGGLAQQGYPLSDEFTEVSDLNHQPYTVQYFERAVFELHPENAGTPYEVLLSQLGTFQYRAKYGGR